MIQKDNNISINSNQSSQRHEQRIKQLKHKILLSEKDIQTLLNSQSKSKSTQIQGIDKFIQKVLELNNLAIENIQKEAIEQSLIYLIEAEKILQKAVEKGKQFSKKIVITVLHNLACCYQKNWQLQTCSSYLEALIFNFNSYLKDLQINPNSTIKQLSELTIQPSTSIKNVSKKAIQLMISIQSKQRLGRYYLQFCAVNSQIKNHSGALIAARKSIQIMKKMFKQLTIFLKNYNNRISKQKRQDFEQKLRLVHQISKITDNINVSQYDMIVQTTKYYLKHWAINQQKQKFLSEKSIELQTKFKNFSIGTIAKMNSINCNQLFEASQNRKNQLIQTQKIVQKVLIIIIGYFIISTQLRLIAQIKNPISQVSDSNYSANIPNHDIQFKQAEIYHLFSIMLSAIFIPFQILYMKHILFAYKNHYNAELFDEKIDYSDQKVYQNFLFTISEIKKPTLLAFDFQDSLRISQIGNQMFLQEGGTEIRCTKNSNSDQLKKFSLLVHSQKNNQNKKSKSKNKKQKIKTKSKSKTKTKSKNKKSTVKTISALSTYSKNKEKLQPNHSKSPQIHTQQSLSRSKNKRSNLKSPRPITSLQTLTQQINKKKIKKEQPHKKKYLYDGIKTQQIKKKKNNHSNGIQQTNAYFLKKKSQLRIKKPAGSTSKQKQLKRNSKQLKINGKSSNIISKQKDSNVHSKKDLANLISVNNPTELYFHKNERIIKPVARQKQLKNKSRQKSLMKNSQIYGNKANQDSRSNNPFSHKSIAHHYH